MQPKSIFLNALSFAAVICSLHQAQATVVVSGFSGASRPYVAPNQSTSPGATPVPNTGNVTIYGGTAGFTLNGTKQNNPTPGLPFNTCSWAGQNGFDPLMACNEAAIDGTVTLSITFKADKDGYPYLYDPNVTSGYALFPLQTGLVGKGATTTISFTWGSICSNFFQTSTSSTGQTDADCMPTSGSRVQRSLALGIAAQAGGTPQQSEDTAATITFIINGSIGQATNERSVSEACSQDGSGLCHFAIGNGDSKVVLRYLKNGQSFPTNGPLNSEYIRVLYSEPFDTEAAAAAAFGTITAASSKRDLRIDVAGTSGGVSLSPARVDGLQNDKYYAFKVAVIDLAGNIGYYTGSNSTPPIVDPDTYCEFTPNPNSTTCHIGHPGEVVGVLSEPVQCYIATAAYGSAMAPQVETFRQFRNQILMPMKWGAGLVKFYYQHSPRYARMIAESESLRAMARLSLWPALAFAWLSLHLGLEAAIVAGLATLFAAAFGFTVSIRAVRNLRRRTKCQTTL